MKAEIILDENSVLVLLFKNNLPFRTFETKTIAEAITKLSMWKIYNNNITIKGGTDHVKKAS